MGRILMMRCSVAMSSPRIRTEDQMPKLNRRMFLAVTASGAAARALLPPLAAKPAGKRILTLVYDKSFGMMRAVDRLVK